MITQHGSATKWVITLWNEKQVLYETGSWLYIPSPLLASPAMDLAGVVRTLCPCLTVQCLSSSPLHKKTGIL